MIQQYSHQKTNSEDTENKISKLEIEEVFNLTKEQERQFLKAAFDEEINRTYPKNYFIIDNSVN